MTLPSCRRLILSAENVEKVVKPPQKPIIKRRRRDVEFTLIQDDSNPIIKHPKIFTTSVPIGK